MNVYIAAPWQNMRDAATVAKWVKNAGLGVASTWFAQGLKADIYEAAPAVMETEAQRDHDELFSADYLLYLNMAKSEGKATELGMAIAWGIPVAVVGGKQGNVFLHHKDVAHYATVQEAIDAIAHY